MSQKVFILFIFLAVVLYSQDKIVNKSIILNQRKASVEILNPSKDLIVVWKSEKNNSQSDIYFTLLDSNLTHLSNDIRVNDFQGFINDDPNIATNRKGLSAVVWSKLDAPNDETGYNIKVRLFQDSVAITSEILVNTFLPYSQSKPQVSMNSSGDFIVVWESWFQDGSDRGIYAQRFNSFGVKIGDEFLVNSTTEYGQIRPIVQYLINEQSIIVWESWNENELGYNLFAKVFNNVNSVVKEEFILNDYLTNNQWYADIAAKSDGGFNAVWCSWEQDGFDGGIYFREFDENFNSLEVETLVNSSVEFYQWLPKIKNLTNGNRIIAWSSWNIDGSREGTYYKLIDKKNKPITLERKINENTESYQWEPDIAVLNSKSIISTWSSWGEISTDYEVFINKISPQYLVGYLEQDKYTHPTGNSTTKFIVHVIDSTSLNGHEYEIKFDKINDDLLSYSIIDLTSDAVITESIPFLYENGVQYLTEQFNGIAVEIIPYFELNINRENSVFIKKSISNVEFVIENPVIEPTIAPIDIAVIWGSSDTLANGKLSSPLDTARSLNNIKEIPIPFYAKNIATDERVEILIFEEGDVNKKWEVGEKIIILTPKIYQSSEFSTHAEVISKVQSSDVQLPTIGDSLFIYTNKPLTINDTYRFQTKNSDLVLNTENDLILNSFQLFQNYPNPFNPTTTVNYTIPNISSNFNSNVKLIIYNVLGQKVGTLVDQKQRYGNYSVTFDGTRYSSGVYFYILQFESKQIVKKMLLLK